MADARKLIITHGGGHVEFDAAVAERRGALRLLARETEDKLGLAPHSYRLCDANGTVKSPEALQQALQTSGSGDCLLEAKETLQGKIARMVERSVLAKIEERLESLESSIMAKVESRLAAVEESVKQTEVDAQSMVRGLVQEALPAHVDGLAQKCAAATLEALSHQVESLAQQCEAAVQELPSSPRAELPERASAPSEPSACWLDTQMGPRAEAKAAPALSAAPWAKSKASAWSGFGEMAPMADAKGRPIELLHSRKGLGAGAWRFDDLRQRTGGTAARALGVSRSQPLLPPLH